MVNRAVQGRYNCIFMEVMGYQDNRSGAHGAYWNSRIIPKATDIIGGIDPLAEVCAQAHAQGLQVHAWLVPYRACDTWPPLGNAYLTDHDEFLTVPRASMGAGAVAFGDPAAYYLDPGSPDVQEHIVGIVRELATSYPIDGIHFDVIRYMQTDAGYPARTWYEGSSLERFQRITGRSDTPPATGDTQWNDFRRRGITELVRRCRAEIPGLANPRQPVRLSAALVTWSNAPSTFASSEAYRLFQNWEEWQRLAYLDTAVVMTYYSESSYPTWYRNWVNKEMTWRYDRHMVVGQAVYLNTFAQSVTQMQYARSAGADGLVNYNYRDTRSDSGSNWDWYPYVASNFYTSTAAVPTMSWRSPGSASEGTLRGRVTDAVTGDPIDDASVQVGALSAVKTDANGWYAVTLIPATGSGTTYSVSASKSGYPTAARNVQIVAGEVRRADFNLGAGNNSPVITQQPSSVVAEPGTAVLFAVQAAGTDVLGYQWRKNGANLTDGENVTGATADLLQLSDVSTADAGEYRCVVTNAYGSATSDPASLTLTTQMISFIVESRSGGQNYANYSETGTWNSTTGKSTAAGVTTGIGHRWCTIGSGATASFSFTPTATATYEVFTTNCTTSNSGNPLVHKVTHAGGVDNVNVCQNTTCTPNACNVWYSLGQYTFNASTTYKVTLDSSSAAGSGPSGNAGRSDAIKWQSVGPVALPPAIIQQPEEQNVCLGTTAVFAVIVSGSPPFEYQWQKDGQNLVDDGHYTGCTTPTLTIHDCDADDVADYRCVVTNDYGSVTSDPATLNLKPLGQPGDFDGDTDVDLTDFGTFQKCLTGANVTPPATGCSDADLDCDNDVDGADLAKFTNCMTGPEIPGAPTCAN